jgi:hypothetical protein
MTIDRDGHFSNYYADDSRNASAFSAVSLRLTKPGNTLETGALTRTFSSAAEKAANDVSGRTLSSTGAGAGATVEPGDNAVLSPRR